MEILLAHLSWLPCTLLKYFHLMYLYTFQREPLYFLLHNNYPTALVVSYLKNKLISYVKQSKQNSLT